MKTVEEIQGQINLMSAYAEQEKQSALTSGDVEDAAQHLRKMYDWRIRVGMLQWVLQES